MATNDPIWSYGETEISLGSIWVEEPSWSYGESYLIGEVGTVILFDAVQIDGLITI